MKYFETRLPLKEVQDKIEKQALDVDVNEETAIGAFKDGSILVASNSPVLDAYLSKEEAYKEKFMSNVALEFLVKANQDLMQVSGNKTFFNF